MDFRKILILIYFQTYGVVYDINDLIELTDLNYSIVTKFISELGREGFIYHDKKLKLYRLSKQGKDFLFDQYLNNISLDELNETIQVPEPLRKTHIFIPKNFLNRLK